MRVAEAAIATITGFLALAGLALAGDLSPAATPAHAAGVAASLTSLPNVPAASGAVRSTPATPAGAVSGPAASAPKTTVAAFTPPHPAAASSPTQTAGGVAPGMRLFLDDPPSETRNPMNWTVHAWKSRHLLEVYYRGYLFRRYHAVFGRSRYGGPKEFEGDRRTPEGDYLIVSKRRSARFRWFMKINYPNEQDREEYDRMRADGDLPRGIGEGGSVGIHGTDNPILNAGDVDWTTGCISVDNADISELESLLPVGTLVIIKP
jgi:hypothetical protein